MYYLANGLIISADTREEVLHEYRFQSQEDFNSGAFSIECTEQNGEGMTIERKKAYQQPIRKIKPEDITELGENLFDIFDELFRMVANEYNSTVKSGLTSCCRQVPYVTLCRNKYNQAIVLSVDEYNRKSILMPTIGLKNEFCNAFATYHQFFYSNDINTMMNEVNKIYPKLFMYFKLYT